MKQTFVGKLTTSIYWWLNRKKPFIVNNEYKIELLFIDKVNNSAKILITNLKTGETVAQTQDEVSSNDGQ